MRNSDSTRLYIGITFLISLVALILAVADISINKLDFSSNAFFTIIGTIITSFAFALGVYFVVLAIRAYDYIREIEELSKKNRRISNEINFMLRSHSEFFVSTIEHQITLEDNLNNSLSKIDDELGSKLQDRKNELRRLRARLSYISPYLDTEIRQKLLIELGQHGEEKDLEPLRQIVNSDYEDPRHKEIAINVISMIEQRMNAVPNKA